MSGLPHTHHQLLELLHEGYETLESLDYDGAASIGKRVASLGELGGFELIAEARMQQGRGQDALEAMQQARDAEPSNWGIVNRLGSICSDLGLHDRAEEAFRRALTLPQADANAIRTNLAILCSRMGRFDEALAWCDLVVEPAWRVPVCDVRIGVLASAARWAEAVTATDGIVEEIRSLDVPGTNRDAYARICALRGKALCRAAGDREGANACARIALALSPTCPEALQVVCEARGLRSSRARRFHLIMRGLWHEPLEREGRVPGFLRTFHVTADDAQEAIGYASDIEPIPLQMRADKVRDDGPAEPGYKGVTSCSGYMFQPS